MINRLAETARVDGDPAADRSGPAEVFSVLLRRPGGSGLPGVTVTVRITAALAALEGTAATPGEVDGLPITAAHVRELAARIASSA
ncbi:hypothetical protein ACI8AC_24810 [Geodermatophilus sp. SYSU D00758]